MEQLEIKKEEIENSILKSIQTIMQNDFELLELEHQKNVLNYQNKILNAAILNLQKHLKVD